MGQENFAGPEYFTEFDPEKFLRDLKNQAAEKDTDGQAPAQAAESDSGA